MATIRVSTTPDGTQGNQDSLGAAISANGTRVAFVSGASNLVAGDTNGNRDVFVKDLVTGALVRASTAADGTQGNGTVGDAGLSADGSRLVFSSDSDNLVPDDTNNQQDIFVKDLTTGSITRVSTGTDGTQANSFSAAPTISGDGTTVSFTTDANNLAAGDTNFQQDVFIKTLATGVTTRVSTAADGTQGNSVSGRGALSNDGSRVAFDSSASNLVAGDTNNTIDIFVKDVRTGAITRASTATDGTQGNDLSRGASISGDGSRVVYQSIATNLVAGDTNSRDDIFLKDLRTGVTTRVSTASDGTQGDGFSQNATISADGTKVIFDSTSTNFSPGASGQTFQTYVKDLTTGSITRVSSANDGSAGNDSSFLGRLTADGSRAAFQSGASNLVAGDTNGRSDVFAVNVVCYCTGTLIRTARGDVAVEALRPGDVAVTADGQHRPIRWIGHRDVVCAAYPDPRDAWPVRVKAGAIGANVPARDLLVSPDHCLLFDDVLVPAKHILNGATIVQEPVEAVTYWHVELDAHVALVAEGAAAESYRDCGMHAFFDGAEGRGTRVAPAAPMALLAPHALTGARLHAVKAWLIARARHLGARRVEDPGLELVADGCVLTPVSVENRRFAYAVPAGTRELVLRSRASVAAHWIADNEDTRLLGVRVSALAIDGVPVAMTDARLAAGWNAAEANGAERWTAGAAGLPVGAHVSFTADWFLGYPVEQAPEAETETTTSARGHERAPALMLRLVANG